MKIIPTKLTQNVRMKQVGDADTHNGPVAHGRTRRPPNSTQMTQSRSHARGMPERNKAQCRARARGQQDARVARGHEGKTDINPKVAHGREWHIHKRGNNGAGARARCILALHRQQKGGYKGGLKPNITINILFYLIFIESSGAGGGT